LWKYQSGYEPGETVFNGTPALVGRVIIFGGLDGIVRGLDAESGELLWAQTLDAPIRTPVAPLGDHVFAGTENGGLYRIDVTSGDITAQLHIQKTPSHTVLPGGDGLVVCLDWASDNSEVAVTDTALTEIRWRHAPLEGDRWTSARPYIDGNHVVVGSKEGWVQAFRATDGELAWQFQVDGMVRGMGFADDIILVGTLSGMVYCLDRTDIHD
jgi:outer membrane protein assembly factor BamB